MPSPRRALVALCITEITSWGVLYYAFPVLLVQIARETGWPTGSTVIAFSTSLLVAAVAGVPVGRLLDRHGARRVMATGSVVGVVAVLAVASAPTLPWFFAAWVAAGLAQSALLYTPAFSALTRWYGPRRVRALTTLSLVAGLASTVFAPLTALLDSRLDWRATYVVLAVVLGAVTLPLHLRYLDLPWPADEPRPERGAGSPHVRAVVLSRAFALLILAMALGAFGMYAATLDLVPLLTSRGTSGTVAALALGLCGAGQVLGRLGYGSLSRRAGPRLRTCGIMAAGAATVALLAAVSGPTGAVIATAIVAGCVRGMFTLVNATAVSDRWGTRDFASLNGVFSLPTTVAIAVAPAGGILFAGWLGGYQPAYALLSSLALAGALVALGTDVRPDPAA